jgi:hypothetical protein
VSVLAPSAPTGLLQGLSAAITESTRVRDCNDAIASTRQPCAPQKTHSRDLSIPAALENYRLSPINQRQGRGAGVGRGLGVGVALGGGVAVGVGVAVALAVAVAVAVAVGLAVAVGVGDGLPQGSIS